jgi:hypothetical protein
MLPTAAYQFRAKMSATISQGLNFEMHLGTRQALYLNSQPLCFLLLLFC